jgi:glycosyltransferase involved in cell wall biosynthesis
MRILWVSNAGWSSQGYGVQVRGLLPHLVSQGHDIAVFAFYGLEGGKVDLPLAGSSGPLLTHYPRLADPYGNDVVAHHAKDWDADIVITLMDVWVLDPNVMRPLNWLAWLPIDQAPIPDPVLARLPHMRRILPYSRFGERLVAQTGLPCTYIPHGVDTDLFRPFPEANRRLAKEALGFADDVFLVGMVGANKGFPSRKGFPEAFQAFAKLRESVPEARLYVHSHIDSTYGGPNLQHLAQSCGIADYVRFPDQYALGVGLPQEAMAVTYNAFDVLLQASSHEGFGLPLIEAQACGTPVVAMNATSMTELVPPGHGGLVQPLQQQLTTLMSWVAVPNVGGLAEALEGVHEFPPDEAERGELRAWAQQFKWKRIADHYWKPMLDQVADELKTGHMAWDRAIAAAQVVEHRHDPSDPDAEPCCPECCDCADCCDGVCDRHGCCCEHVVEELDASFLPDEEVLAMARERLAACPHNEPTPLEQYMQEQREQLIQSIDHALEEAKHR